MAEPVGIVGAGAFGTALADVVRKGGGTVHLVAATGDVAAVARDTRLIVIAVPSPRVVDTVRALGDVVTGRHLVVHAVGAHAQANRRVSDLIRDDTPVKRVGALAGPALARDLADGRPCAMVVASAFDEVTT